jgi:UDP-N-acetylmuramyl pentapeptide synthase
VRVDDRDQYAEALRHRDRLSRVTVIAVTGSCGKTTTKNLVAHVLRAGLRGHASTGSANCGADVAADVLRSRPDDDFYVQELGAWGPGTLSAGLALIQPRIGVVTNLRHDHYSAFHGPRGAQAEKGRLVSGLPSDGTAVLNWDDPYVRELADRTTAEVLSIGRAASAVLRAEDVSSWWPEPLTFRAVLGRRSAPVRTRLHGEHLLGSALAALAVGITLGRSLEEAAASLGTAPPTARRMEVLEGPDGVTWVRDDYKAPADSMPEVLDFLRTARATRKVAVIGRLSDFPGRSRPTYIWAAQQALAVADIVIFVGDRAGELWGRHPTPVTGTALAGAELDPRTPDGQGRGRGVMYVCPTVAQASDLLRSLGRIGDLVLLKGSGPADHLERVMLSRYGPVSCWLAHCGRVVCCDDCEQRTAGSAALSPDGVPAR